jgi:hypothetical protein
MPIRVLRTHWLEREGRPHMDVSSASPRVTILMAIIGNFALADRCIKSIFRYTEEPFSLLLGDNGTGADGRDYFENWRRLPNTHVVRSDCLLRHGEAIDILLKQVHTPYFVLMDSDTEILRKGWLPEMINGFKDDPYVMEVGPDFIKHRENYFAPMDKRVVRQLERFGTWLLMFRSQVLNICQDVSFAFHREWIELDGEAKYSHWDTGCRVHFALLERGYRYHVLPRRFKRNFVHYGRTRWRKDADGAKFSLFSYAHRSYRRWFGHLGAGGYLYNLAKWLGLYE